MHKQTLAQKLYIYAFIYEVYLLVQSAVVLVLPSKLNVYSKLLIKAQIWRNLNFQQQQQKQQ